jgi:hypothetical protein
VSFLFEFVVHLNVRYTVVVYWLRYVRDGETRVVILDGWSLAHARMRAAWLEPGVFIVGYRIDRATAAQLPEEVVGRVLTREEAVVPLVPKKPPAPSLGRRSH